MARGESAFDGPLAGVTVKGSQISEGVATVNVEAFPGGEGSTGEPVYGVLGDGGRPLPPNTDGAAEAICARSADGLPVLAVRDLRIETARAATPEEGTVYKAGYYGAELRFEVVSGEERSTATLTDANGSDIVLDEQGVRVPTSPLVQGDPNVAQDVALAQPLIDVLGALYTFAVNAAAALSGLGTPVDISTLTTKIAPYLAAGSPNAPTTRAPGVRGAPGT